MAVRNLPLFVSPEDVAVRMGLDLTLSGVTEAMTSGIIGAQLYVERLIWGRLARQSHDVTYFLDQDSYSGIQQHGVYRVEVPSGLIRTDVDPLIGYNTTGSFDSFDGADMSLVKTDYKRGYMLFDASQYANSYVRLQVDTGYNDGTDPSMPMEPLPDDLYEAILSMVPILFDNSQVTNRNDEAEKQYKKLSSHAELLLQPYFRGKGFSFRPLW